MKKFILMMLVMVGGVLSASATSKRFFIEVQSSYWQTQAQTVLKLFLKSGSDLNTWPGDACTRIGETNWYYIDVNNDQESATCIVTTKNNEDTWQSNEVSINLSKKNIIYLYDDGGAKLSIQNYDKLVIANADRTKLSDLEQDNYTFKGTLDCSDAESDTYFAIFPYKGDAVGDWSYCFRPNSSGNYELKDFISYNSSTTTTNNSKVWLEKAKSKYKVEFNLVNGTASFVPYFTRSINPHGYSTFASDYAVAIPDGVTATYTTGVSGHVLTEVAFTEGIPANTGALLYKEGGGTVTFTPAATTDTPTDNKFVRGTGTTVAQTDGAGNTNYILTTDGGTKPVGFYMINGTSGNTVGTDKAYLSVSSINAREYFIFGEGNDVSSINASKNLEKNSGVYYNLNGQRITQPTKGFYIVNGKKVIVK